MVLLEIEDSTVGQTKLLAEATRSWGYVQRDTVLWPGGYKSIDLYSISSWILGTKTELTEFTGPSVCPLAHSNCTSRSPPNMDSRRRFAEEKLTTDAYDEARFLDGIGVSAAQGSPCL